MIDLATIKVNDRIKCPRGEGIYGGRYTDPDGNVFALVSIMNRRKREPANYGSFWRLYYCKPEDCEVVK